MKTSFPPSKGTPFTSLTGMTRFYRRSTFNGLVLDLVETADYLQMSRPNLKRTTKFFVMHSSHHFFFLFLPIIYICLKLTSKKIITISQAYSQLKWEQVLLPYWGRNQYFTFILVRHPMTNHSSGTVNLWLRPLKKQRSTAR
jgi:hypothetical protein